MWLFQLNYFHYAGTITAFYFLGWILLQNCQKLWFRNGLQKICSPVASCETAFSVLNTEHLLLFLRTALLYLPVRPGRVPAFGSVWSGHHVNRITQTANSVFQYHTIVRDNISLLKYWFLLISSTNYSGKARRKWAAGTPTTLVCTVGCSEFHPHWGSKWTRHLRWGLQNSARNCKWDGENYSTALTRYS